MAMLTESEAWQKVELAWRPNHTAATLFALPREEAARILRMPTPDLTDVVNTVQAADLPALCRAVARNVHPGAVIADRVLRLLREQRPELVADDVLSSWLHAIGEAQAPVRSRWRTEQSSENLAHLHSDFASRVPIGVPFVELCALMEPATAMGPSRREDARWATYACGNIEVQIWADERGRFNAIKGT